MGQGHQIARYLLIYAMDNDGYLPYEFETENDLHSAVAMYAGGPGDMFYSHNPNGGTFQPNNYLAGIRPADVLNPGGTVLIFESAPWDGGNGRVVAYLSGQVMYMKPFNESQVFPPRMLKGGPTQE
jgi:hypothetical protein